MGSFYNHFDSKEQLFEAAVAEVLDAHGALLDQPHLVYRGPGRDLRMQFSAHRTDLPQAPAGESDTAGQRHRAAVVEPRPGPARAARHRGGREGRPFTVDDPELALSVAGGALLGLGNLLRNQPDRDDAAAADAVTEDVLRLSPTCRRGARNLPPPPSGSGIFRVARFRIADYAHEQGKWGPRRR